MQVILLQDVAKIGRRFDEVDVPNGYALNKLIPQGAAVPATPEQKKRVAAMATKSQLVKQAGAEQFAAAKAVLAEKALTIAKEANEQQHLYEAIHARDIVAAAAAVGAVLVESQVIFTEPVKSLGEHEVTIREGDASFTLTLIVEASNS